MKNEKRKPILHVKIPFPCKMLRSLGNSKDDFISFLDLFKNKFEEKFELIFTTNDVEIIPDNSTIIIINVDNNTNFKKLIDDINKISDEDIVENEENNI